MQFYQSSKSSMNMGATNRKGDVVLERTDSRIAYGAKKKITWIKTDKILIPASIDGVDMGVEGQVIARMSKGDLVFYSSDRRYVESGKRVHCSGYFVFFLNGYVGWSSMHRTDKTILDDIAVATKKPMAIAVTSPYLTSATPPREKTKLTRSWLLKVEERLINAGLIDVGECFAEFYARGHTLVKR